MSDEERQCIICLDAPQKQNPLFLLTCGCRTAWFHDTCEKEWMEHLTYPPKCPTCRRIIEITLQYSFAFHHGINQQYFWWIASLFCIEVCMASTFTFSDYYQVWNLPCQSIFILSIPYISSSKNDLLYFLHQLRYRYIVFVIAWFIHIIKYKKLISLYPDNTFNMLIIVGAVHVFSLIIQEFQNYCSPFHYSVDPHTAFTIGYTFPHKEILLFRESSPIPLKGNTRRITNRI
jgi:hypothetical protein